MHIGDFRFSLSAVLLLVFTASAAIAEEASKRSYTLGVGNATLLPYFGHCNGTFCGDARTLLDKFASDTGINLQYEPTPVIRIREQIELGHVDGFFPDNPKWLAVAPERKGLCFSAPAIAYREGMLTLPANSEKAISSYALLYKWELPKAAEAALTEGATRLYVETTPALIDLLLKKRVDAVYANLGVAEHDARALGQRPNSLTLHSATPVDHDHYFMSGLKDTDLLQLFNSWLAEKTKTAPAKPACT